MAAFVDNPTSNLIYHGQYPVSTAFCAYFTWFVCSSFMFAHMLQAWQGPVLGAFTLPLDPIWCSQNRPRSSARDSQENRQVSSLYIWCKSNVLKPWKYEITENTRVTENCRHGRYWNYFHHGISLGLCSIKIEAVTEDDDPGVYVMLVKLINISFVLIYLHNGLKQLCVTLILYWFMHIQCSCICIYILSHHVIK